MMLCGSYRVQQIICFIFLRVLRFAVGIGDPLKRFLVLWLLGFHLFDNYTRCGHNAKAHAIAYMPLVIAGFILVFRKKYILGGLVTMFATARNKC
jgi:hypothetical protein